VAREPHARERDADEFPRADRLSGRRVDVVRPDGEDSCDGGSLRPWGGNGEAHRMTSTTLEVGRPRESPFGRIWALVKHHVLTVYALLAFVYLMLPIAIVIAFSFNNPAGRFNYTWSSFTLNNWQNWDGVPGLRSAMVLSLEIAL